MDAPPPTGSCGGGSCEEGCGPSPSTSVALAPAATRPPPRKPRRVVRQLVPKEILNDPELNEAIAVLNPNYEFEIHKTVWRVRKGKLQRVALQFPEGLLMYACAIADILRRFAPTLQRVVVLGDVTYGACCVDDLSAKAMGCELLIHYGHSCLVPVDETSIPCMYIFVAMRIDLRHLIDSIKLSFPPETHVVLSGTIQFNKEVHAAKKALATHFRAMDVPQAKPLSSGEVLGCTAPRLLPAASSLPSRGGEQAQASQGETVIVFVADGRFHLEALMIANPDIPAYRYDPYARVLTRERYDHEDMRRVRRGMVERAQAARRFGLILGTLGRQGSPAILSRLKRLLEQRGLPFVVVLMSELSPAKLRLFGPDVEAWIQVACPRLSIDWGEGFDVPVLTPYEGMVCLGAVPPWWEGAGEGDGTGEAETSTGNVGPIEASLGHYRMDFYGANAGPWGNKWKEPAVAS